MNGWFNNNNNNKTLAWRQQKESVVRLGYNLKYKIIYSNKKNISKFMRVNYLSIHTHICTHAYIMVAVDLLDEYNHCRQVKSMITGFEFRVILLQY